MGRDSKGRLEKDYSGSGSSGRVALTKRLSNNLDMGNSTEALAAEFTMVEVVERASQPVVVQKCY